jgi:hypothetical protein
VLHPLRNLVGEAVDVIRQDGSVDPAIFPVSIPPNQVCAPGLPGSRLLLESSLALLLVESFVRLGDTCRSLQTLLDYPTLWRQAATRAFNSHLTVLIYLKWRTSANGLTVTLRQLYRS